MLADLDRPIQSYHYDDWNKDVLIRPISAQQYVDVMGRLSAAGEDDTATKIDIFAMICSYGISDPACKPEEWSTGVKLATLTHLGNKVLEVTNKVQGEAAKKN